MRVAFYAPLKAPTHPRPSGDRRMARLLMRALEMGGHEPALASGFRAYDPAGDAGTQARLAAKGRRVADALIRRSRALPAAKRPQALFTYHLYHKAPDHLGPAVSAALGIPYVVAEPSIAPKRRKGNWAPGYAAAAAAVGRADAALCLIAVDAEGVRPALKRGARLTMLPPFLDGAPFRRAAADRERHRRALDARLPRDEPRLLAVGMMRPGDKLASYRVLARALAMIQDRRWRLVVVGDGAARAEIETAFAPIAARALFLGARKPASLPAMYAGCDLYVWPGVREAYGMAILEAQAAGLPVVAGRGIGVGDVVADGRSGMLVDSDDAAGFARAVAALLDDPKRRRAMGADALMHAAARHDILQSVDLLDQTLRFAAARKRKPRG
ncbi:MAG: glycosyltransferase family 4 protein [Rhodospirillales bacterium]